MNSHQTKKDDWDDATLRQRWNIASRTTTYNYRRNGLEYEMRGGIIFYSYESRENFKKKFKLNVEN
ncbi:MAG: hypothetical protein ACERKD_12070 [Prolixibacteraceae bacterium]